MPSLCVSTSYSANFHEIGDLAAATVRSYALIHRATAYVDADLSLDRPSPWHRVKLIQELFATGVDFVMWLDADACFVKYDQDVRSLITDDKHLYMVKHHFEYQGKQLVIPNTGVMLLRNCDWTIDLLQKLWAMEQYINHGWWENAAMLNLLGFKEVLGEGPDDYNQDVLDKIAFIPLEWNSLPNIDCSPTPIINHYAGQPREVRLKRMPEDAIRGHMAAVTYLCAQRDEHQVGQRSRVALVDRSEDMRV